MRVLVACEFSGIVRDAFETRGHYVMSCDILPSEPRMNIGPLHPGFHFQGDVRKVLHWGWDLMIAHPPCTRLANSGVRWLSVPPRGKTIKQMWQEFEAGIELYELIRRADIKKKAIENPIMNPYARKRLNPGKRQIVQPWWFGEKAFKATGFELIGLPELKPTNKLIPPKPGTAEHKQWSKVHRASPGPDRWKERSRTFAGIAAAMAAQWG